ncbi:hypothetical protein FACUT_12682 [Fusarium acutatum]|uniref:Uncharacterized protein n=1 Tax=Fusarium acutatum TaxID=78861 RepID=A0A8H4NEL8_9HYPO|nr:hypothetical protein FACUT_12682 [Fusarium acutatum]
MYGGYESNKKRVPGGSNGIDFWTTAFPKFQDTVQGAFTNDQAKKQLQYISSQHGQIEGEHDYANLFESGLDSLNLSEEISRNVDQFLNRIPDISDGQSADDALRILPNEEGVKSSGVVDQGSSVDPGRITAEQQPSQASSPLGSTNQLVENSSPKRGEASVERGFVDYLPPNRREIVEIETRLIASLIENERLKKELVEHYQPDAHVLHTLQQYMETSRMRVQRNRTFNTDSPDMSPKEISRTYMGLLWEMQNACAQACRYNPEAPDVQASRSDLVESWALNTFKRNLKDCIYQFRESKLCKDKLLLGIRVPMSFIKQTGMFYHSSSESISPKSSRKVDELDRILHEHLYFFYLSPNGDTEDREEASRQNAVFSFFLTSALQFKIDLTSTTTPLKFFYYEPDEAFDDTRMERCMFSDREKNTIKACLFPLLLFAPAREETPTSKDYALEYNTKYSMYFTRIFEESHLDLDLAAKAVVLT